MSASEAALRRQAAQKASDLSDLAMSESEALAAVAQLRARLDGEVARNVGLEVERAAVAVRLQELDGLVGGGPGGEGLLQGGCCWCMVVMPECSALWQAQPQSKLTQPAWHP